MSYCRFRNTLADLRDCRENLAEAIGPGEEAEARISLVLECVRILEMVGLETSIESTQKEFAAIVREALRNYFSGKVKKQLRIAEKALEDIRGLCVSSTYWNNPAYPNCARLLKQHHKIVSDAKVKAEEMRAIEYGDDVEVPIREHS
jgi:hypothetical protein